jgi:putative FmdB family regulatory protein
LPTYEYACTACGHRLDAVQSFTDDPLTVCPECGGALRKVYGAVGIVLKGSGFYKTDTRASDKRAGAEAAKASSGGSDTSSNGNGKESSSDSGTKTESSKPSSGGESSSKESKPAATTAS